MAAMRYQFRVELEDGTTHDVTVDQRDVASWEMQPFGTSGFEATNRIHLFMRYTAWHALKRTKATKLTWEAFAEQCVEVSDQPSTEEGEEGLDPGQPAPSDTP